MSPPAEPGDYQRYLDKITENLPVFALVLCIVDDEDYITKIIPAANRLKFDFFGSEAVILHSYDIRKAKGPFQILQKSQTRGLFLERISTFMKAGDYTLIAVAIRKSEHLKKYGEKARNPYLLAFEFALERLLDLLERTGQSEIRIIAEKRGRRENAELAYAFQQLIKDGTPFVSHNKFNSVRFSLDFASKEMNLVGHQIADLAAYPIARHVAKHAGFSMIEEGDQAYKVIASKFHRKEYGLKIFPI